jgi:hypothetical protein
MNNILNFKCINEYQIKAKNDIIENFVNYTNDYEYVKNKTFRKIKFLNNDDEYIHTNLANAKYTLHSFQYQKITSTNIIPVKLTTRSINQHVFDNVLKDTPGWRMECKYTHNFFYFCDKQVKGDDLINKVVKVLQDNPEKVNHISRHSKLYKIIKPEYKPIEGEWKCVKGYHEFFKLEKITKEKHVDYQTSLRQMIRNPENSNQRGYNQIGNSYFIKIEPFQESDKRIMLNLTTDEYEYVDETLIVAHSCNRCEVLKNVSEFSCNGSTYCKDCSKIMHEKHRNTMRGKLLGIYNAIENERRFNEPYLTLEEFLLQYIKQGGLCAYSNKPLDFTSNNEKSISKERIDNNKGYTKDNILFVLRIFNVSPGRIENSDWSIDKFQKLNSLKNDNVDIEQLKVDIQDAKINKQGNQGEQKNKLSAEIQTMKEEMTTEEWKRYYHRTYLQNYRKTMKGFILGNIHGHYDNDKDVFGRKGTITFESILDLILQQNGRCAVSGVPLKLKQTNEFAISIDRIDNTKPHDIENVRLVCKEFNYWGDFHWTRELFEEIFN